MLRHDIVCIIRPVFGPRPSTRYRTKAKDIVSAKSGELNREDQGVEGSDSV